MHSTAGKLKITIRTSDPELRDDTYEELIKSKQAGEFVSIDGLEPLMNTPRCRLYTRRWIAPSSGLMASPCSLDLEPGVQFLGGIVSHTPAHPAVSQDFSELYHVQELESLPKDNLGAKPPSLFGRVRMHDQSPNTRILRITAHREKKEKIDYEVEKMQKARGVTSVRTSLGSTMSTAAETFREILPSESLAKNVDDKAEIRALSQATEEDAWRWMGFEVQLHGISLALIDSVPTAPRELLQLNMRGLRVELVQSQEVGMRCKFALRGLSVDNLLPDNFNPVLLDASRHAEHEEEEDCLMVKVDRRDDKTYRAIKVDLAPVRSPLPEPTPPSVSRPPPRNAWS